MNSPFPVLGLTGGIASGKSFLCGMLSSRGWHVIDADVAGRKVVEPGSEGLTALVADFGPTVLLPDGRLDRQALGQLVFRDAAARSRLEALLHPRIEAHMFRELAEIRKPCAGAVLDAALWVERGLGHHFDQLWVVEAPEALRVARLQARDGLDPQAALSRIRAQAHPAERRLHADRVFQADGRDLTPDLEEALQQLQAAWPELRKARRPEPEPPPLPPPLLQQLLESLLGGGGSRAELFLERYWPGGGAAPEDFVRLSLTRGGTSSTRSWPSLDGIRLNALAQEMAGRASSLRLPPLFLQTHPTPNLQESPWAGPVQQVWVASADLEATGNSTVQLVWDRRPIPKAPIQATAPRAQGTRPTPAPILLTPAAAAQFLGEALRWIWESFPHRLGTRISTPALTLIEDGTLPGFLGSTAIGDDGRPAGRRVLVKDGQLLAPPSNPASGHSPRPSLLALPGPRTSVDPLEGPGRGYRVQSLASGCFNAPTGDFAFRVTRAQGIGQEGGQAWLAGGWICGNLWETLESIEPGSELQAFGRLHAVLQGPPISGAMPTLFCPTLQTAEAVEWADPHP